MKVQLAALGLLAITLTACGSPHTAAGAPGSASATQTRAVKAKLMIDRTLSPTQAQAALVTVADLPVGYAAVAPSADTNNTTCGLPDPKGYVFQKQVLFGRGTFGPFVTEVIQQYATVAAARADYAAFVRYSTGCKTYKEDDNTLTMSVMSFPRVGDESRAVRISGSQGSDLDLVYLRNGTTNIGVAVAAYMSSADVDLLQRLAKLAVKRVR